MDLNGRSNDDEALTSLKRQPGRYVLPKMRVVEPVPQDAVIPAREAVIHLASRIRDAFVVPSLSTTSTKAEFIRYWHEHLYEMHQSIEALSLFFSQIEEPEPREVAESIQRAAKAVAGEPAIADLEFAAATWERAGRIAARLPRLPEPSDLDRDRALANDFVVGTTMHLVGWACLLALGSGLARVSAPEIVDAVFEFLRKGSMDAYAAARQAYDLRRVQEPLGALTPVDEGWDAEDQGLATADGEVDAIAAMIRGRDES